MMLLEQFCKTWYFALPSLESLILLRELGGPQNIVGDTSIILYTYTEALQVLRNRGGKLW